MNRRASSIPAPSIPVDANTLLIDQFLVLRACDNHRNTEIVSIASIPADADTLSSTPILPLPTGHRRALSVCIPHQPILALALPIGQHFGVLTGESAGAPTPDVARVALAVPQGVGAEGRALLAHSIDPEETVGAEALPVGNHFVGPAIDGPIEALLVGWIVLSAGRASRALPIDHNIPIVAVASPVCCIVLGILPTH